MDSEVKNEIFNLILHLKQRIITLENRLNIIDNMLINVFLSIKPDSI